MPGSEQEAEGTKGTLGRNPVELSSPFSIYVSVDSEIETCRRSKRIRWSSLPVRSQLIA